LFNHLKITTRSLDTSFRRYDDPNELQAETWICNIPCTWSSLMPTTTWPAHPRIYEINAWPWLHALSQTAGKPLTLGEIPGEVLSEVIPPCDAVWLMGVWERSPAARDIAWRHAGLQGEYRNVFHDVKESDVVGSPYAVHAYRVDGYFGGPEGLRQFRSRLARQGMRLILDYVPNHTALDHAWLESKPGAYIQGTPAELAEGPEAFFSCGGKVFAHGRDPYFPPWTDSAQVNAFSAQARQLALQTLLQIAGASDGVRCDMAMLLLTAIFRQTWGERAGAQPVREFWAEIISAVRERYPDFIWIAEAYWDKEWELQQLGFDYCYDKRLYDRLVQGPPVPVRQHLQAEWDYQRKLLRFIENHDEPRASAVLGVLRSQAAALLALTLPGARLIFMGQAQGATVKLPIQLGRAPQEPRNAGLEAFYKRLLAAAPYRQSPQDVWKLCEVRPVEAGPQRPNPLLAYTWRLGQEFLVIVVNYGGAPARGNVQLADWQPGSADWTFTDRLTGRNYTYHGDDLAVFGLYVELPTWGGHIFEVKKA
jgi:hypothetical protein